MLADLGSILLSQKFSDPAIRLFQQAAAAEPGNARYAYVLGVALERSGKASEAINELRRSIQLDPSQPDPYIALSELYGKLGEEDKRKEILRSYLQFMPQNLTFPKLIR